MRIPTKIVTGAASLLMLAPMAVSAAAAPPAHAAEAPTLYVSATASAGGDGSAAHPFRTIGEANRATTTDGTTIVVGDGTYTGTTSADLDFRAHSVKVVAAKGAHPVVSGAVVVDTRTITRQSDGTYATPATYQRFNDWATVRPDAEREGMARYVEQVFVDGKPLTQVDSRDKVRAGTFYVADSNPIVPVTRHRATPSSDGVPAGHSDNRDGFTWASGRDGGGASYVFGQDLTGHDVRIVQAGRGVVMNQPNSVWNGVGVTQFSPTQDPSGQNPTKDKRTKGKNVDPKGTASGFAVQVSGTDDVVANTDVSYSAAGTALGMSSATGAKVLDNTFHDNGGNAMGDNRSSNVLVRGNSFTRSNSANFLVSGCTKWCTVSDVKVTHAREVRFEGNTFDRSGGGVDYGDPDSWGSGADKTAALWFDEGVYDSDVVGNTFTNVPIAFDSEVSSTNVFAGNTVTNAVQGVLIAGTDDMEVWNNTFTNVANAVFVSDDARSDHQDRYGHYAGRTDGCNARAADGSCSSVEKWSNNQWNGSGSKPQSWDTTGAMIYNNVFNGSTQSASNGWLWAANVMTDPHPNWDGSVQDANAMIGGIDSNVYNRPVFKAVGNVDAGGARTLTDNGIAWVQRADAADARRGTWLSPSSMRSSSAVSSSVKGREAHGYKNQSDWSALKGTVLDARAASALGKPSGAQIGVGAASYTPTSAGVELRQPSWPATTPQPTVEAAPSGTVVSSSSSHLGTVSIISQSDTSNLEVGDTIDYVIGVNVADGAGTYDWATKAGTASSGPLMADEATTTWKGLAAGSQVYSPVMHYTITQADVAAGSWYPGVTVRAYRPGTTATVGSVTASDPTKGVVDLSRARAAAVRANSVASVSENDLASLTLRVVDPQPFYHVGDKIEYKLDVATKDYSGRGTAYDWTLADAGNMLDGAYQHVGWKAVRPGTTLSTSAGVLVHTVTADDLAAGSFTPGVSVKALQAGTTTKVGSTTINGQWASVQGSVTISPSSD